MSTLNVLGYNVGFGDAILVEIPDKDGRGKPVTRTILIDVGNALSGEGGRLDYLEAALRAIAERLGERRVDLYVMTHEHMDHVKGLLYGTSKLGIDIRAERAWLTASAEGEDYYSRYPEARRQRKLALGKLDEVRKFAATLAAPPEELLGLLEINDFQSSEKCIAHLRGVGTKTPLYVHRETDIADQHPFRAAEIRVLAPEADTSVYYGRFAHQPLSAAPLELVASQAINTLPLPPPGVAAGAFYDLVRFRAAGAYGNMIAIDKAANNSSIVFEIEWNGWRLLFAADAEERSWDIMRRRGLLQPVHFLKLGHHGSRNGCPPEALDALLPETPPDGRDRFVLVSTREGQYSGVPDPKLLADIERRASLFDTRTLKPGEPWELTFEA